LDAQGNLLVRLPERNVLRYANGTFENILDLLPQRELAITKMYRTENGDVVLAGLTNGLLRFSKGSLETIIPISALPPPPITTITQSSDGHIWLGTQEAGLFYASGGHVTPMTKGLPSLTIHSSLRDNSDVWIGTAAGVTRWKGGTLTTD